MDGKWIHHFTPESKRLSSQKTASGDPHPKRPKAKQAAVKAMASIFLDLHGVRYIDYLEKGNIINSEYK